MKGLVNDRAMQLLDVPLRSRVAEGPEAKPWDIPVETVVTVADLIAFGPLACAGRRLGCWSPV